jgi:hypothetical protein
LQAALPIAGEQARRTVGAIDGESQLHRGCRVCGSACHWFPVLLLAVCCVGFSRTGQLAF